jgi:hypothetical protein
MTKTFFRPDGEYPRIEDYCSFDEEDGRIIEDGVHTEFICDLQNQQI